MINASGWPCAGWVVRGTVAWRWLKLAFLREWPGVLGHYLPVELWSLWALRVLRPCGLVFLSPLLKQYTCVRRERDASFLWGRPLSLHFCWHSGKIPQPSSNRLLGHRISWPVRATGSAGRPLCQVPAWELSTSVRSPKPWVLFIPSLVENVSKKTDLQKILELM